MLESSINTRSVDGHQYPFVSVIIPVYDDAIRLSKCLSALERQTYPVHAFEVIVVDDDSNENIASIVSEFPHTRILYQNHQGSYAARNKGISETKGQIIAFTDSDCTPEKDWIFKGVANLLGTDNCGLVGGKIELIFKDKCKPTTAELYDSITFFQQRYYVEKAYFSVTANLFTFKQIIDKVGLFNSKLISGGDIDWCRRVHSSGYNLKYADDVVVAHPARYSFSQIYNKTMRITQGRLDMAENSSSFVKQMLTIMAKDVLPPIQRVCNVWHDDRLFCSMEKLRVIGLVFVMKYAVLLKKIESALLQKDPR